MCVVGEIGSGKSSLLHQLLGQMVYIPQKEIDFVGGADSLISKTEMLALKLALFESPIKVEDAPVRVSGEISFVG